MIPVRLAISGFLSYQDPAELDFSGLHVACISGKNGAGKSAMLDAMTWALFGEARKNDDSVINDNAPDNTAKVEFQFRYEDADYLVRRQKTRGKSGVVEFYIRAADGETWKQLGEKRSSDTNKRICTVLHMDYKTFINASFFLQGKADQFTGQNAGERKKILSNILNLEIWETYKAKAAEKRKLAENSAGYIKGLIDEADEELKQENILRGELEEARQKAAEMEKSYQDIDEKWKLAKANEVSLKTLKENTEQKLRDENRLSRLISGQQETLARRKQDLAKLRAELSNAEMIEKNYQQLQAVRARLDLVSAAAAEAGRLETERVRLESAINNAESALQFELAQLSREKKDLDGRRTDRERLETFRKKYSEKFEILTKSCDALPAARQNLQDILDQGRKNKSDLDNMNKQAAEIDDRLQKFLANRGGICPTCGREMDEEHCRIHSAELKEQIRSIREQQAQIDAEQAAVRVKYKASLAEISRMEEQEKELHRLNPELARIEQQLRTIDEQFSGWEKKKERYASAAAALQNASFCPDERARLAALQEEIRQTAYDPSEHKRLNAEKTSLAGAEKEHQALIAARSQIEPLERDVTEKQKALAEAMEQLETVRNERAAAENDYQNLRALMPDMQRIESERIRINQLRDRVNKELGQVEQKVKHLEDARKQLESLTAEYREKQIVIRRYKDLEKAFGKDGIPALLIEQAVPEIEEQANEILQQLSNGSMSLRMNTQGTYKSKKDEVKETLDILISDPYGVREYEMFSGGEAFRINFSIRLALSRILAQRAGSRLQTLVIDEGFGSQDEDGRTRLVEAITAVRDDFEKILVITHLPELKDQFPARIEVEKTPSGSKMEVIL